MFEYDEFEIPTDGEEPVLVMCQVDLTMTDRGEAPAAASMNYPGDPGEPPTFEIEEIRLYDVPVEEGPFAKPVITLELNETQFISFFANGQDVVNNAYEWASENETDFYDDDQH